MRREKYDFKFEAGKLPSSRFPLLTASASVLRIHHQLFITIDKTIHKVLGHLKAESTIVQVFLMQSYVENVFFVLVFFRGDFAQKIFFSHSPIRKSHIASSERASYLSSPDVQLGPLFSKFFYSF